MLKDKRVLIVDDDEMNIFALSAILKSRKIEHLIAQNGKEAIEMLKNDPQIDVILMDMMMPEMDGYEAIRTIREDEKFKDTPIISLTAQAMKGDREKCLEAGASGYVSKPIDIDELISEMNHCLNHD